MEGVKIRMPRLNIKLNNAQAMLDEQFKDKNKND